MSSVGLGEPVSLLGHSYGGLCALEAALLSRNVRALALYEHTREVHQPVKIAEYWGANWSVVASRDAPSSPQPP